MTDTQKPMPGWYDAYAERAELHVGKENEEGQSSLNVLIHYRLVDSGYPMDKYHCLIKKDGTFSARKDGVTEKEILERRYGWDLSDVSFTAESMSPDIIVRVLLAEEMFNGKTSLKIAYVADPNEAPQKADPKDVQARFGQMLRATSAKVKRPGQTATASAAAAPKAPANKAAPPAKLSGVSNQQECWELFCSTSKEADEGKRTENWFALLERVNPGIQQDDFASQEWFNVACEIRKHMGKDEVPF